MLTRWLGNKIRRFTTVLYLSIIAISSLFIYTRLKQEYCGCQFWGCLGPKTVKEDPMIQLKRQVSAVLLKAANDVKWGRKASAVADLQSAAALLDRRHDLHIHSGSSKLVRKFPQSHVQDSLSHSALYESSSPSHAENIGDLRNSVENLSLQEYSLNSVLFPKEIEEEIGEETESYSNKTLAKLVTIVLDESEIGEENNVIGRLNSLLSQIRQLWAHISVVIGVNSDYIIDMLILSDTNLSVVKVSSSTSKSNPLETLIQYVKTHYVLWLKSTSAVTSDLVLSKLLKVATTVNSAGVIGVAERGSDGGWNYACSQIKHENSQLTLQEGYEYSRGSCVFCDVTSQSYFAVSRILRAVPPDYSLPGSVRQIDWAIRLRLASILTLTCPEVMVHTTHRIIPQTADQSTEQPCTTIEAKRKAKDRHLVVKRLYRKLAQKWELTTINLQNKTSLEYSCLEIHFDCRAKSRVRHFILPPCCIRIKNKMIKTLNTVTKETLVPYEVNSGTLLGAIKFKDAIPWDFDDDCIYPNKYVMIFKKNKLHMRQLGLSPTFSELNNKLNPSVKHQYITMVGQGGFSFDLMGVENFSSESSLYELQGIPSSLPCLQYGHFPVHIYSFLQEADNITTEIHKQRLESRRIHIKPQEILIGKNKKVISNSASFPPFPAKSCFLQSFVRIGSNWAVGPWNPVLKAKEQYGENFFQHRAHWRFEQNNNSWPSCSYLGHPLCLDIHPLDGNIPFQ